MTAPPVLNAIQQSAVTYKHGPLCILAGAGSGKTRVVIHRIAHLIEKEFQPPWSILAVTFTNKAAEEMRKRIDFLCPGAGPEVQVGTFHSMAARLLRRHGSWVGVPSSFVIYDQDDSKRLMRRIVDRHKWPRDCIRPILHRIDLWQCEGLSPEEIPSSPWDPMEEKAIAAFDLYRQELSHMEALDFGGLLVKWRDLLHHKRALEIRSGVRHLLVDEYQDTNRVQAEIVGAFVSTTKTVTVVGDDDQAIYGWRGASADNLRDFVHKTPNASLMRLEENYRSTEHILAAADGIIRHNDLRLGKVLRPVRGSGRRVRLMRCRDDINEARQVIRMMQDHLHQGGSLDEVAVLYRTNAHSRLFEDELRRSELAYRLVGGTRFYDRKEIKDVLATLRCALNPKSTIDTLRMLTAIPRGIGARSLEKFQHIAVEYGLALLEVMHDDNLMAQHQIGPRIRKAARALSTDLFDLRQKILPADHPDASPSRICINAQEAVVQTIAISKIADRLQQDGTLEAEGRLENLAALVSAAAQYVEDVQARNASDDVVGFLEAASLLEAEEQNQRHAAGPKATLMTLHAAKGLEFPMVFLVGWEEHGFPHSRALENGEENQEQLEEERRLAYVGITRAEERLVITWAGRRMVQGNARTRHPSRFLRELPRNAVEGDRPQFSHHADVSSEVRHHTPYGDPAFFEPRVEYDPDHAPQVRKKQGRKTTLQQLESDAPIDAASFRKKAIENTVSPDRHKLRPKETSPEDRDPTDTSPRDLGGFARGAKVSHLRYGEGVIVGFRGAGRRLCALVRFGRDQTPRMIVCRFLSLASRPKEMGESS